MRMLVVLAGLLLGGCASLPTLHSSSIAERSSALASCQAVFVRSSWQTSHSIDAQMPLNHNTLLMGVTVVQPTGFRSVLMSIEGLVLFDGELQGQRVVVHRALPPLDHSGFAEGLMADVRYVLFPPVGELTVVGQEEASGALACRWTEVDERTVDVLRVEKTHWRIRTFRGTSLEREADLWYPNDKGFFQDILLRVPGIGGYTLRMKLIDQGTAAQGTAG
jgi:hypothetical protein